MSNGLEHVDPHGDNEPLLQPQGSYYHPSSGLQQQQAPHIIPPYNTYNGPSSYVPPGTNGFYPEPVMAGGPVFPVYYPDQSPNYLHQGVAVPSSPSYNWPAAAVSSLGHTPPMHPMEHSAFRSPGNASMMPLPEAVTDTPPFVDNSVLLATTPGCYYPIPTLSPQQITGDPITALAHDDNFDRPTIAMATSSVSMSGGRVRFNDHKASMLITHDVYDAKLLYSSVAGHPEAPLDVLKQIYNAIYGRRVYSTESSLLSNQTSPTTTSAKSVPRHRIPSHAYRPPYVSNNNNPAVTFGNKGTYQMGVNTIITAGLGGYRASVSPSAVRLHSHGGLLLADWHVEGMICGTLHPVSSGKYLVVGGMALAANNKNSTSLRTSTHHIVCVDIWQEFKTISSCSLLGLNGDSEMNGSNADVAVTCLASHSKNGSILAGCSDGNIRLLDARLMRPCANIKSHAGGIVNMAISSEGNLLATTGYSSRVSGTFSQQSTDALGYYGFPDPMVLIYDIRYLGRGGTPYQFAGMGGGPRFLTFISDAHQASLSASRLLVASGQASGGLEIIYPFQETSSASEDFILPPMEPRELITSMCGTGELLALGTSLGNVFQYKMTGYVNTNGLPVEQVQATNGLLRPFENETGLRQDCTVSNVTVQGSFGNRQKEALPIPQFEPLPPVLSIDASLLAKEGSGTRAGSTPRLNSIFSSYILTKDPMVSRLGVSNDASATSFGQLSASKILVPSKLQISSEFLDKVKDTVDFVRTIPTADLNVNVFEDHRPGHVKQRLNSTILLNNPNKMLYSPTLHALVYQESLNRSKKFVQRKDGCLDDNVSDLLFVPLRYRLTTRPMHKSAASFNHAEFNDTGCIPGWDYPGSMPNAFVPPVLMLLYLLHDIKSCTTSFFSDGPSLLASKGKGLSSELLFLFHRIESISRSAMLFFPAAGTNTLFKIGAWAPTNFISCLTAMPEADHLQILDNSPAAVDAPLRVEAFYRFLLYQLDKELSTSKSPRPLDAVAGIDFLCVNEYICGSDVPSVSMTRAMTVDISYNASPPIGSASSLSPTFGEILQQSLSRACRLRAWNQGSKAYEAIIQRKIAMSLPRLLSLSCACAGRKESEGLQFWRGDSSEHSDHWLPEFIEIELKENGLVVVSQLFCDARTGQKEWRSYVGKELPPAVSKIVTENSIGSMPSKRQYRLEAVISLVRDDLDKQSTEVADEKPFASHYVVHARVRKADRMKYLNNQCLELEKYLSSIESANEFSLLGGCSVRESLQTRLDLAKQRHESLNDSDNDDTWILFNGYVVSDTVVEDARAFHVKFKEPSLVIFRAMDPVDDSASLSTSALHLPIPAEVMNMPSLSANSTVSTNSSIAECDTLPGAGDLLAFDAEFVSLHEEESVLTEAGSKVTLCETRHAVARISVMDCRAASKVLLDDFVLPREPVVDYLTRFSGIVAKDLDPQQSPHNLIGTGAAYLKLRFLMERGCIFVGHGLQQDFWTVNLHVPPQQIIDTLELYHKPAQRYISLRFLANFVLKRDMQQDQHDSVEDAMAAFELYKTARELKQLGQFDRLLDDLYEYGQRNDWKLGIDVN